MKKILLAFCLICVKLCSIVSAQDTAQYITETETHIFWQADRKLTFDDFQHDMTKDSTILKIMNEAGVQGDAKTNLWFTVDVPKKKQKKSCIPDVLHVAPVFQKEGSFILNNDSATYITLQNLFDLRELEARFIRKELFNLRDQVDVDTWVNFYSMFTMTAVSIGDKVYHDFLYSYAISMFKEKAEGTFEEWRYIIDTTLNSLQEFATTPEDCHRFATDKPIDNRYKPAKNIMGPLVDVNRKEE